MDMADGSTVMIFKYDANSDNGQGQTEYSIDFSANVVADVLIVGGGGGGGHWFGGGGGAGGFMYKTGMPLQGTIGLKVGAGGAGAPNAGTSQSRTKAMEKIVS